LSDTPLIVWLYGDITCPWTYLVLARLRRLEERLDGRFALGWRPLPITPLSPGSEPEREGRDGARGHGSAPGSAPEPAEFERMGLPCASAPSAAIAGDALRAVEFARDLDGNLARTVLDGLFRHGFAAGARLHSRQGLLDVCEELGLDREGLTHALTDGRYDPELERAETEAELYGIESVPTLLAGKSKLVGAAPEQLLEAVIRRALEEASEPAT
jgi:predicted DsbA family dithiol-disulfide isomerase